MNVENAKKYLAELGKDIDEFFIIDGREIKKPTTATYKHIAVAGDNNANSLFFLYNRYINGVDILGKAISIYYLNSEMEWGTQLADNITVVSDDCIAFEWLLSEEACAVAGNLLFRIVVSGENYKLNTLDCLLSVDKTDFIEDTIINPTPGLLESVDNKIVAINTLLVNIQNLSDNCDDKYNKVEKLYNEILKIEDSNAIAIQALRRNVYTMQEVDELIGNISSSGESNNSNYYTKAEIDRAIAEYKRVNKFATIYPRYLANTGLLINTTEKGNVINVVEDSTNTALNYINLASSVCLTDVIYCNNKPIEVYTDDDGNIALLQSDYKTSYINLGGVA